MNCSRPFSYPLGLLACLASLAGCNGAQVAFAPPIDAGPPCSTLAPVYTSCDAGEAPVPMCAADPGSTDVNVSRIPEGSYPQGCSVQFYFNVNGAGCAPAQNPCTCLASDAGAGDAASIPGQWSNCADAAVPTQE